MGEGSQILLVSRRYLLTSVGCAALLSGCRERGNGQQPGVVDPADHDSFFLWAGVSAPEVLDHAKTVYLLAGEVHHDDPGRFVPLRATPSVRHAQLWLVVRVERIDWGEAVYREVLRRLALWQEARNRLVGLQIDFDAATLGLAGYTDFLRGLRERLPGNLALSVTGLLDWSAGGDPRALTGLADIVDEVVIQTYQGRHTIPGYEAYLTTLTRLPMPYRIALVEGGEWREPAGLARDPEFRGYVVFLLDG